jgi:hypothetical protein
MNNPANIEQRRSYPISEKKITIHTIFGIKNIFLLQSQGFLSGFTGTFHSLHIGIDGIKKPPREGAGRDLLRSVCCQVT